ncbi:MAG: hypothetical protein A2W31_04850 [Planctomycetes bacterium RBG_16_64_10]|nr:MAG: hypothetical protein A2W31_04850 [Planctomycetes bacterium RBG_16_64_10]
MGWPKATLPFGPEQMLQRMVRLVGQVAQSVLVVAAPEQDVPELPAGVRLVRDRQPGRGPLEGLATGLAAIGHDADAVYLSGCDSPLLVPAFVERLFALVGDYDLVIPRDGARLHPLAAVYRTGVLRDVEALLAAGQLQPALLCARTRALQVPVDWLRAVDPQLATLRNINAPEDYFEALRQAGYPVPDSGRKPI